jgi:membrane protease YdiL (CAAX protease family)
MKVGNGPRGDRARSLGLLAVYGGLTAFALVLGAVRGESPFITTPWLPFGGLTLIATSLALGAALALGTVVTTRALVRFFAWAKTLHEALRPAVKDAPTGRLLAMAVLSGMGEELFFRGLLVPALGVIASSLLFGVLHQVPGKARFVWAGWACFMGLAFAGLFRLTGSLAGPILAHVVINGSNLVFLRDTAAIPKSRKLGGILRA